MNKTQADEYLKTLVSAFVWVASADEGVDGAEWKKYEHAILESQFATQFTAENIRAYFKDMVAVFRQDYEAAIALTKERLRKIRGQNHLTEEVLRLGRAALVGDGKIAESEEVVLAEIARTLGVREN